MTSHDRSRVGVCTLVKGREGHLRNLLAGLARGTRLPDRCVVVDMGRHALTLPDLPFPVVLHHMPSDGLPLAAARNMAARIAATPDLIFLDVDCIPSRELVAALAEDIATADALICCEVLYLSARDQGLDESAMLERGMRHPVREFPPAGLRAESNAGLFWSLAFGMRKASFDRLGGFDEAFSGYGAEDTDFAFRARATGVPLLFAGSAKAFHQYHAIHDPPLHHFADIVANANRFRQLHGIWPMDGWLDAFARMGLITAPSDASALHVLRMPTQAEIAASACPPERCF
ncbi:glycosyltransferase family 2 protein [Plastoroseomonas arctica]|uniref:Glycosyltransferase n=1 Tax=Plastoroseomonas arctica TaxID=1509237 RepID=A0AAF1K3V3_9PROT|nr:galactosyltransferase-related protein [Plastoroseomonas arctica]MBR0656238.1 glycosyltransferase [Plastoroseomonas arctica]